jgi:hypothetical protein
MSKSQKRFSKQKFDDGELGGHQLKKIKKMYENKKSNTIRNALKSKDIYKIMNHEDQF